MTTPKYLLDASSIVKALKNASLVPLGGQAIQRLTVYEVLNAFWKEAYLLRRFDPEEASSLVNDLIDLISEMLVLEPKGLERDIFQIALSRRITVYDASYIAVARKYNLILVTEDKKLFRAASNIVGVASLDDIMH